MADAEVLTNEKNHHASGAAVIVRLWVLGVLALLAAYAAYVGTVLINNPLATALGLFLTAAVPAGLLTLLVAAIATGVRLGLRR